MTCRFGDQFSRSGRVNRSGELGLYLAQDRHTEGEPDEDIDQVAHRSGGSRLGCASRTQRAGDRVRVLRHHLGPLPKNGGAPSPAPLTNVRGGRHDCYDRLVMDIRGAENGFQVRYVSQVYDQGGTVIPLRGGALLEIVLLDPAYDDTGASTYDPADPQELVNVSGWRTFRQVAWGGSYEGYTTIGLGARARLPFRVFSLAGPGSSSRVLDVAHRR